MRSCYFLVGVIFFISCNKIPDCTDCQAEVFINDNLFEVDNVRAYGQSISSDRFTFNFSKEDNSGIIREGFSVSRIPKSEGSYSVISTLDRLDFSEPAIGSYITYIADGDVIGYFYKPDTNFVQNVEVINWNPDEGFVEGQINGTYVHDGGPTTDPDTIVISTNVFKIQWEGNRE